MKRKDLMEAVSGIDEKYISEFADPEKLKRKVFPIGYKFALAACLCAVIAALIGIKHYTPLTFTLGGEVPTGESENSETPTGDSPVVTPPDISEDDTSFAPSKPEPTDTSPDTSEPSSHQKPGPGTVYSKLGADYETAKKLFGYSIKKCSDKSFTGYELGVMSSRGVFSLADIDDSAKVIDVIYKFKGGTVTVHRQRNGVYITPYKGDKQIEYKGREFCIDDNTGDENTIKYWLLPVPKEDEALCYIACFDKSAKREEVFDLILSLEITE